MGVTDTLRAAIAEGLSRGETFYSIGKGCGIHQQIISRFVSGERDLRGETIDKLATYFGLDLRPTSGGAEPPKKKSAKKK